MVERETEDKEDRKMHKEKWQLIFYTFVEVCGEYLPKDFFLFLFLLFLHIFFFLMNDMKCKHFLLCLPPSVKYKREIQKLVINSDFLDTCGAVDISSQYCGNHDICDPSKIDI